jgi:hypothetical protein
MNFRALYDGAIVMEFDFERGVGAAYLTFGQPYYDYEICICSNSLFSCNVVTVLPFNYIKQHYICSIKRLIKSTLVLATEHFKVQIISA